VLPARQVAPGTPWVIKRTDLDLPSVHQALTAKRGRPETDNADQGSLDLSTT